MNAAYPLPFLRLGTRPVLPVPIDPLREALKKAKETPVVYPPELLKPRREAFLRQIDEKKAGRVPARPAGS